MHIMTEDGWQPLAVFCVNENDVQGVYRPEQLEVSQAHNDERAEYYANSVNEYINGRLPKERIFSIFALPRTGAFGEKL